MSDEVRYVRLKPVDVKAGLVVRDFTQRHGGKFFRFREAGVWYEVSVGLAEKLAQAHQIPQRPASPTVFDVCTEREARAIDVSAARERDEKKAVEEPSVDTARKVAVDEQGRGDLSLDEIIAGRKNALEEASARALGEGALAPKPLPSKPTTNKVAAKTPSKPKGKSSRKRKRS